MKKTLLVLSLGFWIYAGGLPVPDSTDDVGKFTVEYYPSRVRVLSKETRRVLWDTNEIAPKALGLKDDEFVAGPRPIRPDILAVDEKGKMLYFAAWTEQASNGTFVVYRFPLPPKPTAKISRYERLFTDGGAGIRDLAFSPNREYLAYSNGVNKGAGGSYAFAAAFDFSKKAVISIPLPEHVQNRIVNLESYSWLDDGGLELRFIEYQDCEKKDVTPEPQKKESKFSKVFDFKTGRYR